MEQVGGDHYKSDYQHWDWAVDVGLGPLEYGATRYICRHWKKGGVEDLKKAKHFVWKMRSLGNSYISRYKKIRTEDWKLYLDRFLNKNEIPEKEALLCEMLSRWSNRYNLDYIDVLLDQLIESSEMAVGAATTGQATTPTQPNSKDVPAPAPAPATAQDKGRVNQPNPFGFTEE